MITIFETEPPLGSRILLDDQAYELVGSEPYRRKSDGVMSRVLTWETLCPVDGCGASFRVQTGLSIKSLCRRCVEHKDPTSAVGRPGCKVVVRVELA
jgi:hypothetical protein